VNLKAKERDPAHGALTITLFFYLPPTSTSTGGRRSSILDGPIEVLRAAG
jgi:hypothetical protein